LNTVVSVSAAGVSEPDGARLPLQPLDAVQVVALLLLQESFVVALASTRAGLAVNVAVGNGGGATAMLRELLASPPGPEQVNLKLLVDVNAAVDSVPDVARLTLQPPDAVQELAFVLLQESGVPSP